MAASKINLNGIHELDLDLGTPLTTSVSAGVVSVTGAAGSGVELQTDGVDNTLQTKLNLKHGTNVTLVPDSLGGVVINASGGTGTVSSVQVAVPSRQTASGGPVTGAGTITIADNTQTANTVFKGPNSGSPAVPTFAPLVPADLPIATTSNVGAVKADGTTILVSGTGVISAVAGGGGGSLFGTFGSLPAIIPASGTVYKCTDSPYQFISNGTIWQPFFDGDSMSLPPSAGWTWDNQGTSTSSLSKGFAALSFAGNATTTWRHYIQTAPAAPYTLTFRSRKIDWSGIGSATAGGGLGLTFRDSTGKFISFYALMQSANQGLGIEKWNSDTSFNSSYNSLFANGPFYGASQFAMNRDLWLQVSDNNTNLVWRWSIDGLNWTVFDTQPRTAFLTSGPTQICVSGRVDNPEGITANVFGWTIA